MACLQDLMCDGNVTSKGAGMICNNSDGQIEDKGK